MFAWLSWLLSNRPAPWNDEERGWFGWLDTVDGSGFFDAARTTATLLAIIGIGGAAFVAYRRQATTELTYNFTVRAHAVAVDAQATAAKQLALDSQKYDLDRANHELETQRRVDDRERELRTQFASVAAQLGSAQFMTRHAAVFALASLADAWHRLGNDVERQACVDLFCSQLRTPRVKDPRDNPKGIGGATMTEYLQDNEIRQTMVASLRAHRPLVAESEDNWKSCSLDLHGADLSGYYLNEVDLRSVNFDDANLSYSKFIESDLSDALMTRVNVSSANFNRADMANVKLFSARTDESSDPKRPWMNSVQFNDADLRDAHLTNARLPHSEFESANLTGARMANADLRNTHFSGAILTAARLDGSQLAGANLRQADVRDASLRGCDLTDAHFDGIRHNENTRWPKDSPPEGIGPPMPPETDEQE
ncbi:hypothetical protein MSZK_01770 [Mycobacterium sp. shizuoka-1]|nr:hypothetical protein MSZK_01770 [Mycobacterium sp. shizuoka-1]